MSNDRQYMLPEPSDGYASKYFDALLSDETHGIVPFAWRRSDEGYELFFSDINEQRKVDALNIIHKLHAEDRDRRIILYSLKPISPSTLREFESDEAYMKLICFGTTCVKAEPAASSNGSTITVVDHYDPRLDEELRKKFVGDRRLYLEDERMRRVHEWEMYEDFSEIADQCEHRYVIYNDELVGYICGMPLSADVWGKEFFLIAAVWIVEIADSQVRSCVKEAIDRWMKSKPFPQAAAIYANNPISVRFFAKRGFEPFFLRIIPW